MAKLVWLTTPDVEAAAGAIGAQRLDRFGITGWRLGSSDNSLCSPAYDGLCVFCSAASVHSQAVHNRAVSDHMRLWRLARGPNYVVEVSIG